MKRYICCNDNGKKWLKVKQREDGIINRNLLRFISVVSPKRMYKISDTYISQPIFLLSYSTSVSLN